MLSSMAKADARQDDSTHTSNEIERFGRGIAGTTEMSKDEEHGSVVAHDADETPFRFLRWVWQSDGSDIDLHKRDGGQCTEIAHKIGHVDDRATKCPVSENKTMDVDQCGQCTHDDGHHGEADAQNGPHPQFPGPASSDVADHSSQWTGFFGGANVRTHLHNHMLARSLDSDIDGGSREDICHADGKTCDRKRMLAYVHPGTDGGTDGSSKCADALPLQVNSVTACPVNSENFKGEVLFLHRQEAGCDHPYADFFSGVKRQFEFRVQGVFKKTPRELYVVAELEQPLGLSYASRVLMNALLTVGCTIASARGAPVMYNIDMEYDAEGKEVRHGWVSPLHAVNCLFRTPPGQTPPPITQPLPEMKMPEKIQELEQIENGDTLTFAFWDKYLNFEKWEMCNMPLGLNVGWHSIIGDRRVHIAFYDWVGPGEGMLAGVHAQANKEYLFSIVLDVVGHESTDTSADDVHASAEDRPHRSQDEEMTVAHKTKDSASSCMSMRRWGETVVKQIVCRLCVGRR